MNDLRDLILAAQDRPAAERVNVPEWGCDVHLRVMSGAERDDYEAETYRLNGTDIELNRANSRARLLVRCLCDEHGKRIFADGDVELLGAKAGPVLDRLFARAQRVNKLRKKDMEDLAKNSDAGPVDTSRSASPATSD